MDWLSQNEAILNGLKGAWHSLGSLACIFEIKEFWEIIQLGKESMKFL